MQIEETIRAIRKFIAKQFRGTRITLIARIILEYESYHNRTIRVIRNRNKNREASIYAAKELFHVKQR